MWQANEIAAERMCTSVVWQKPMNKGLFGVKLLPVCRKHVCSGFPDAFFNFVRLTKNGTGFLVCLNIAT